MSDGIQHALDLMFASLTDGDLQPGVRLDLSHLLHVGRTRHPIFESHPPLQTNDLLIPQYTLQLNQLGLWHMIARMQQGLRECALVCQQHQPFAVEIEPTDREHANVYTPQEILHGQPSTWIIE